MDLRRYKHLLMLATEKNFARAASRLHLSQSALSRSIQAAEQEFGMPLFERSKSDIKPTPAGEFVLQRAKKLVFESRCLERDVALYRQKQLGDLAFGMGPFPAAFLLPQMLLPIRQAYPAVRLRVEVNNWQYLCQHLKDEQLDFFVANIQDIPQRQEFQILPLWCQQGQMYVRAGHPLLQQRRPGLAEVLRYGLASVRLPAAVQQALQQAAEQLDGAAQLILLECDDVASLKQLSAASDTVLAAVDAALQPELASGLLQRLEVDGIADIYSEVGVVWLRGRSHTPLAAQLLDSLTRMADGSRFVL